MLDPSYLIKLIVRRVVSKHKKMSQGRKKPRKGPIKTRRAWAEKRRIHLRVDGVGFKGEEGHEAN